MVHNNEAVFYYVMKSINRTVLNSTFNTFFPILLIILYLVNSLIYIQKWWLLVISVNNIIKILIIESKSDFSFCCEAGFNPVIVIPKTTII